LASYNNRSLFSDYYLEDLVTEDSHWQAFKSKAWEFRQHITNILERAVPGINGDTPEAEVERRLIRPILDVLGHVYFVQPAVHSPEGIRRPDYAFFSSPEVRQEAESHKGQPEFFRNALAIGDAKAWERSLDKRVKGPGDPFTNHNPSYQIDFYLRSTDKRWGLLTNGRHWRLYHRDLSYRLDVYYEVDLPQIITLDENAFLNFLAFFHKEAFQPDGTGACFLDRAYRASTEYAAKVSEELKDNIYEALRLLAEGFLSFPANNLKPENLDLVRENAFIVIYRLLFTLYAEAREFLPVTNPTYWGTYSLRALTHEIATKEPFESKLSPTTTMYWSRLRELFNLINSGDHFLHIPPYNGRLFDDQKEHQSLAAWKIGDRYLAAAIDQLARARAAGRTGRGFVSYRDLGIRELGSIYEGLLEHQPRYATQDVAVVKENKREKFVPLMEVGNRKVLKTYRVGSVYLETVKGERKSTGSYYTPQYIVEYIVRNTLEPLLEEAKSSDGNLIDSILSLKVLDPAMGSGHFLVEATDFLARALVEALGGDPREMEEDEVRWARREVVERCIYGVDLNPLAVDLAKLSLWLSTVSLDKPLNFLDHHLSCGNSLIGARLEDIGLLPEIGKKSKPTAVTTLGGHQFKSAIASAVSTFHKIAEEPSDSVEDIQRKEGAYETARYALSRIKSIADVWTSVYFENEVKDKDAYERLLSLAEQDSSEWPKQGELPWLDKAKAIADERHFFHWELAFPEVFFDQNGQLLQNPGFSAVVGNPPYVLTSSKEDPEQVAEHFRQRRAIESLSYGLLWGRWDIFVAFVERALALAQASGSHSFIVSHAIEFAPYAELLRKRLSQEWTVVAVVHFGDFEVFPGVGVNPIVYQVKNSKPTTSHEVRYAIWRDPSDADPETVWSETQHSVANALRGPAGSLGFPNIATGSTLRLSDLCFISGGAQIQSDQETRRGDFTKDDLIAGQHSAIYNRPYVEGKDIDRYLVDMVRFVAFDAFASKMKRPRFRELFENCKLIIGLSSKAALDNGSEPSGFFYPNHSVILGVRWCDLSGVNNRSISKALRKTKQEQSDSERFRLEKLSSSYDLHYILALANSRLLRSYERAVIARHPIFLTEDALKDYPIRRINFTTPKAERQQLVEQSKSLYEEYLQTKDWGSVKSFIAQLLPQKQDGIPDMERERSDVVHDLLAFQAEEMTRLHKEKQAEIKGFLGWLEGYLGIGIEDLRNKTKVKEYWRTEVGWDGFLGALQQNKNAIQSAKGIDVTRREPQENIWGEFDTSIAKLRPLLERIELTDKLIDQIIYKLYGLTPEEIEIVEGSRN